MITSEFILSSLIIILIPGTGAIFTITTGITHSTKASVYAAIGCTLGILPHLTASVLGLSAIMNMGAHIFSIIRYIGVVYLLYLAWSMWKESGSIDFENSTVNDSERNMIQIIL
jgi:threonine/homoserine/homoserine lactone efflux protein